MYKNLKTAFGENLKYIRKSKGYTQEKLAEFLGISHRQLSRIESGDNFPSVETLEKISLYLETDLKTLFDFEWDKKYAVILQITAGNFRKSKLKVFRSLKI